MEAPPKEECEALEELRKLVADEYTLAVAKEGFARMSPEDRARVTRVLEQAQDAVHELRAMLSDDEALAITQGIFEKGMDEISGRAREAMDKIRHLVVPPEKG